jgi:hypothetical protein
MRLVDGINWLASQLGYLYIFHYKEKGVELFKIGVSNKPRRRLQQVNSALPGEVSLIASFPVFSPYTFESQLHRKFAKVRQTPENAGAGAGANEFFRLSLGQYAYLWAYCLLKTAILHTFPFSLIALGLLLSGKAENVLLAIAKLML